MEKKLNLRERILQRFVIEPLGNHLIEKAAQDRPSMPTGAVLREQVNLYGPNDTAERKMLNNVPADTLRKFSVQYDVARAAINRRKRQLNQLEWDIVAAEADDDADYSKIRREIKQQFKGIGGYRVRFREFLDVMVEDLLVLDALAIYKRPNRAGGLYSMQVVDGSTIKLRVDASGGTPMPPEVAYKQVIRGNVVAEFTADEMYYEMMNPRTNTPYGLSPLESLILGVSTALKSEVFNLHLLTEGNIPEGLFGVPESWKPKDIKEFQELWDASLAGDTRATSRLRFAPDGKYTPTKKPEDMRYKELQEWLMQKTCMMFEIQPQELGFTDTVNKATGEVQQDIGLSTGLKPLANFFAEIFTDVIQTDMGYENLKFEFKGLDVRDEKRIAETNEILIRSGQRTIDELRTDEGMKPLGVDKPFVLGNPTFIDNESTERRNAAADALISMGQSGNDPNEDEPTDEGNKKNGGDDNDQEIDQTSEKGADQKHIELVTELRAFRKYAINRKKAGKSIRRFESTVLPAKVVDQLNEEVQKAEDPDAVRDLFKEYMHDYQIDFLADVVNLKETLHKIGT